VFGAAAAAGGGGILCASFSVLKRSWNLILDRTFVELGLARSFKGPRSASAKYPGFKIVLRRRSPACTPADRASSFEVFSTPAAARPSKF
jgi:hypothetical protein